MFSLFVLLLLLLLVVVVEVLVVVVEVVVCLCARARVCVCVCVCLGPDTRHPVVRELRKVKGGGGETKLEFQALGRACKAIFANILQAIKRTLDSSSLSSGDL